MLHIMLLLSVAGSSYLRTDQSRENEHLAIYSGTSGRVHGAVGM